MARILYISFGYEPYWSGGMVYNELGLMRHLIQLGHKITHFTACRYDLSYKPYLKRKYINRIDSIEIVNSPSVYDPFCYRVNPRNHCINNMIDDFTRKVIGLVSPDIAHMSDLRMHAASIIDVLYSMGIPMIKTMHNYWDICPKGDLMINDEKLCEDYDNGNSCIRCLSPYTAYKIPFFHRIKGTIPYGRLRPLLKPWRRYKSLVGSREQASMPESMEYSSQAYFNRRKYFIEKLNKCSLIHVSSADVADRFSKYNINKDRIKTISLSVDGLTNIKPKEDYASHYPVVFGYRGEIHRRKGILTLLDAFSRLDQTKAKLIIYGEGERKIFKVYLERGLNIEYRGAYDRKRLNDVLNEIDVGIVPSIWAEIFGIVGLEYINARVPVIASNIGGIGEWLINEKNGLLVDPGDVDELTMAMERFIRDPTLINSFQSRTTRWKSMQTYTGQINKLYESCGVHS